MSARTKINDHCREVAVRGGSTVLRISTCRTSFNRKQLSLIFLIKKWEKQRQEIKDLRYKPVSCKE